MGDVRAMVFKVTLGSKVSGKYGPFLPLDQACDTNSRKRKRRTRAALKGVVIKSLPNGIWRVYWGDTNRSSVHKTINSLGIDSGLAKGDLDTLDCEEIYLGDVRE